MMMITKQAAAYLGVARSTLERWRLEGNGPIYLTLGRAVRYRQEDLDQYLASQRRRCTSEYRPKKQCVK